MHLYCLVNEEREVVYVTSNREDAFRVKDKRPHLKLTMLVCRSEVSSG